MTLFNKKHIKNKFAIKINYICVNIRYKSSAKLNEKFSVITKVTKISPFSVTFNQVIKNADSDQIYTDSDVVVVAVTNEGKLYRRLPEMIKEKFNEDIICSD